MPYNAVPFNRSPNSVPLSLDAAHPGNTLGRFVQESFETSTLAQIFDAQVGTTASLDATHTKFGSQALKIHKTGAANASIKTMPGALGRVLVGRYWQWLGANPSVSTTIMQAQTGLSGVQNVSAAGISAGGFSGVTISSGITVSDSNWHSFDFRLDTRGSTWLYDWMVDGVAQTQATHAPSGTEVISQFAFDKVGASTIDYWIDAWQLTDDWGSYPLTDAPFQPTSVLNTITISLSQAPSIAFGPTTSFKILSTSEPTTVSLVKAITHGAITVTQTSTLTVAKQVAKPIALAETATLAVAKQVGKPVAVTQATTVSLAKRVGKALNVAETAAISCGKAITHGAIALTQATTVGITKLVGKPIALTETAALSVTARLVHLVTIALTQASSVALVKQVGKVIAVAETASVTVAKRCSKAISVAEIATITLAKQVGKTISVAEAAAISVTARLVHLLTIALTQATTLSVSKRIGKTATVAQTTTVSVAKRASKLVGLVETAALSVAAVATTSFHAVTSMFQSSPQPGVSDSPANTEFGDSPTGGMGSNPSSGKFG